MLGKTKTTGPDKPQKEIVAHVYRTISLTGEDWLGVGYQIWNEEQFVYRRDYLVMEPNFDWSGARRKFVTPAGFAGRWANCLCHSGGSFSGAWFLAHCCFQTALLFFSGHSPRNYLTSVAALRVLVGTCVPI